MKRFQPANPPEVQQNHHLILANLYPLLSHLFDCVMPDFDCTAEMVPYNLPHFPHPCGSDAGGTSPWTYPRAPSLAHAHAQFTLGEGRTMQEQLSRATHGAIITPRHAGLDPVSMDSSFRWNDGSGLSGPQPAREWHRGVISKATSVE